MNYLNYASFVRKLTGTDNTSFTNEDLVLLTNIAKDDIAEVIVQLNENFFNVTSTTDLVAAQREYPFPNDLLRSVKTIEAQLDGTNWRRLKEFDLNSYTLTQENPPKPYNNRNADGAKSQATTDETTITEQFSDDTPMYEIDDRALVLYTGSTIIDVTGGLKLKCMTYPRNYITADLSSTTDMSVRQVDTSTYMPRPSHLTMAIRTSILFKQSNNIPLEDLDKFYEVELEKMKAKLKKPNLDSVVQPKVPRQLGYNY